MIHRQKERSNVFFKCIYPRWKSASIRKQMNSDDIYASNLRISNASFWITCFSFIYHRSHSSANVTPAILSPANDISQVVSMQILEHFPYRNGGSQWMPCGANQMHLNTTIRSMYMFWHKYRRFFSRLVLKALKCVLSYCKEDNTSVPHLCRSHREFRSDCSALWNCAKYKRHIPEFIGLS